MTISAEILKDSINKNGTRITTWVLEYPRFVHAEFMTHRVFSRNAASSRAIPTSKFIEDVMNSPAMPVYWGKNQSGMQANEELPPEKIEEAIKVWNHARDYAVAAVKQMQEIGVHKQITNRLLEPWFNIRVIATATEHENFFELRAHKDAQPEIRELAYQMKQLYSSGAPMLLQEGEWHMPFSDKMPTGASIEQQLKIATARCARVSYLNFSGTMDVSKDEEIYNRLLTAPLHASPMEHCACNIESNYGNISKTRNFRDWTQYRSILEQKIKEGGL